MSSASNLRPRLKCFILKCIAYCEAQWNLYSSICGENISVGKMTDVQFCIQMSFLSGIYTHAHKITERKILTRGLPANINS